MEFKLGSISIVVISSPNQMKEVLQIHDPLFATRPKSVILDMFTYGWKDVIWASYGDDWCQNVKVMCIRILQYIGYKLPRKFEMKNCSCALHEIFEHCKVWVHDFIFSLHFKFVAQFERVHRALWTLRSTSKPNTLFINLNIHNKGKWKPFETWKTQHNFIVMLNNLQDEKSINAQALLHKTNLNIIPQTFFSKRYFIENDFYNKKCEEFKNFIAKFTHMASIFNINDYIPYLKPFDFQGLIPQAKQISMKIDQFFDKIIHDHLNEQQVDESKDFVDMLLSLPPIEDFGDRLDYNKIKAILLVMFILLHVDWNFKCLCILTNGNLFSYLSRSQIIHHFGSRVLHVREANFHGIPQLVDDAKMTILFWLRCIDCRCWNFPHHHRMGVCGTFETPQNHGEAPIWIEPCGGRWMCNRWRWHTSIEIPTSCCERNFSPSSSTPFVVTTWKHARLWNGRLPHTCKDMHHYQWMGYSSTSFCI